MNDSTGFFIGIFFVFAMVILVLGLKIATMIDVFGWETTKRLLQEKDKKNEDD